jgi:hypothetical protein
MSEGSAKPYLAQIVLRARKVALVHCLRVAEQLSDERPLLGNLTAVVLAWQARARVAGKPCR